jgi:hypothetical protein
MYFSNYLLIYAGLRHYRAPLFGMHVLNEIACPKRNCSRSDVTEAPGVARPFAHSITAYNDMPNCLGSFKSTRGPIITNFDIRNTVLRDPFIFDGW